MSRNDWTRRTVLRAAGASLLLPFLPSLAPRAAWGQEAAPPVRLVYWYVANGMHMADWRPSSTGAGYDLPYILEPLASVQSKVSVLSGLANMSGSYPRPGDHARGTGCFITCRTPEYTGDASVRNGISIDQVVAREIGEATPFPSLQLGLEGGANSGQCDSGYPCSYQRSISWTDELTPLPKVTDPRLLFDRLFGGTGDNDPVAAARRRALQLSVLDAVADDAAGIKNRLSATDARKLDQYMTGVREVEKRLEGLGGGSCSTPDRPERNLDLPTRSRLMNEMMTVALECDVSRTVTYMFANGGSGRSHSWIGRSGNHHGFSHHQGNPDSHAALRDIDRWEVGELADFLQRLDGVTEADGSTLLDNTLVMFGSEISDGDRHNHDDLPVLLAGGGGGAVRQGRHISFPRRTPIANLLISMANAAGVPISSFGVDGTGPLSELA